MSRFDENLFGRIALLNDCVTREELERCLEISRSAPERGHLGIVLRQEGYLSEEQLEHITRIRDKKVRKYVRRRGGSGDEDREFAHELLERGLLDLDCLEEAVLEQQTLRQVNLHFSLPEVVASKGWVGVDVILALEAERGRATLSCDACDAHFRIVDYEAGETFDCPSCGADLGPPAFLDSVMVDGVLGARERVMDSEAIA